jgi:LPS export ABC transporter protein LptC
MNRHIFPIAALAALAFGSAWLLDSVDERQAAEQASADFEPDSTMENFVRWGMDLDGAPKNRLQAEFMAHFAYDDSSEFDKPEVELYRTEGSPWHVVAERAWVNGAGDVMILYGEVTIWRDNDDGSRLELQTRDLKVLLDNEYAETDHPVTLRDKVSVIDAIGMRADFSRSRIEFLDEVKSRHVPSKS